MTPLPPPAHPYRDLPDIQYWRRAMTDPAPGHVDPVTRAALIEPQHRVATLGSCFAQRLGQQIAATGLNLFVTEPGPAGLSPEGALAHGYGVYSARYGNVYTVRQALQLFDRAFGRFAPQDRCWRLGERFVDPFRPGVEPTGWATPQALEADREHHLACVREMFRGFDWLVFTLGMTETFRSRADGAVYPVAPGVQGGAFDPALHEFCNFGVAEIVTDLAALLDRIVQVNPRGRVLLTVSPVSLMATGEPRHIWASTTVTKARLRVAADEIEQRYPQVVYFPSYEVITSPAANGRYWADDLRQVSDLGLRHVMRLFRRHCLGIDDARAAAEAPQVLRDVDGPVVCDDEEIEAAIRRAGLG